MTNLKSYRWIGAAFCAVAFLGLTGARADDVTASGATVALTGSGGNVRAAGATVTVGGNASTVQVAGAVIELGVTTTGTVKAAGAKVSFAGSSGGDLDIAGADVSVKGHVAHDAHIGGAVVDISLSIGGSLSAGGATVTISPTTDVGGDLQGGGAVVTIGGHVARKVTLGGAKIVFNGRADGAVDLTGDTIIIGPLAQIGGDLIVRSPHPAQIDPAAKIAGQTTQVAPPEWVPRIPRGWSVILAVGIAVGTILAGIVLLLFGGRVFGTAVGHVRHRPLSSFLFGVLTVVLVPFIAVVLMASIAGLSVGFAILFLMPFLLVFGHAVAAAGIAAGVLLRRSGDIGGLMSFVLLVVGAAILAALGFIPVVGPLIVAIALVLGVGAFTRTVGHRLRRADPPAPVQ